MHFTCNTARHGAYQHIARPEFLFRIQIGNQFTNGQRVANHLAEDKSGTGQWTLIEDYFKPPFYQFDYMTVIDCDRYYRLNLEKYAWSYGEVSSYVGACSEEDYLSKAEIRLIMVNKLIEDGFEFDQNLIPGIP